MSIHEKYIKLIECPRDAMQGWKNYIETQKKIQYINQLLKVGFDTIDFGSFVSPKSIPQMADTKNVIDKLCLDNTQTKLLAIVANVRGAQEASVFEKITYLGFPFSISPTFQLRNTNSTIEKSLDNVKEIKTICDKHNKQLVVYISMAFGNPYGDEYSKNTVYEWVNRLVDEGIAIISLADTVGVAEPFQVKELTKEVIQSFSNIEVGVHLHSTSKNRKEKIDAALESGCIRFDGAINGIGGCPMADDVLVGNMNTEWMIDYFQKLGHCKEINMDALTKSLQLASEIFI